MQRFARSDPVMAPVRAISHVAIETSDLEKSMAFYQAVLGLDVFQDERTDAQQPQVKGLIAGFAVELYQRRSPAMHATGDVGSTRPCASPCITFAIDDAEGAFRRLKETGHVHAQAITENRGAKYFFVSDPDGYIFELIEFPPGLTTLADIAPLLRK